MPINPITLTNQIAHADVANFEQRAEALRHTRLKSRLVPQGDRQVVQVYSKPPRAAWALIAFRRNPEDGAQRLRDHLAGLPIDLDSLPRELAQGRLAGELGRGNEKTVYAMNGIGLAGVAVGVLIDPDQGQLSQMKVATDDLLARGFPVVRCSAPIVVTMQTGLRLDGCYMERVPDAVSSMDISDQVTHGVGDKHALARNVTHETLGDLDRIEAMLRGGVGGGLAVLDFQFLIGHDGRVKINDPAEVYLIDASGSGRQTQGRNLRQIAEVRRFVVDALQAA